MEILAVTTAPVAKATVPKAVEDGAAQEFGACLEEATAALETPAVEISEEAPVASGEVGAVELAPALMAQIQGVQAPVANTTATEGNGFILPRGETPQTIGQVLPAELTKSPKLDVSDGKLPSAPGGIEVSVEVFEVGGAGARSSELGAFRAAEGPEAQGSRLEALGSGIEGESSLGEVREAKSGFEADLAVTQETADFLENSPDEDAESGPEPDADLATALDGAPKAEPKGEAKAEFSLRTDGASKTVSVGRPEARLDTHNVVRELANRIELMAAAKSPEGVIVHLSPADLGSITLLVKPESGGAITAEMGASNDQVRQALQGSQQALTRQLELRGLSVANVSVSAETAGYDPQRHQGQQQQQTAYQPRQFQHASTFQGPGYGNRDSVARPTRLKATGVDLWI